jgi:hypothetical protein
MALTLKQFFQRTDPARKQRAKYVKITGMKTGHLRSGLAYVACKSYSTHKVNEQGKLVRVSQPNHHITVLTFINNKLQVHVACSCEDNTYRWEWANTQKDAAVIEYSDGSPPDYTNPKYRASMCKHMVALTMKIGPKLPAQYRPSL